MTGTMMLKKLLCPLALLVFALLPAAASAATYDIDAVHSSVMFRAKRMDVVYVYGRFNEFAGTIDMTGDDVSTGKVSLEVKTSSVDTGNQRRDDHLRNPDFFNSTQLPTMKFESTGVKAGSGNNFEVSGNLTLHGVTKPVTATVEKVGSGKDPRSGKTLVGFEARFTIKRSDFDMKYQVGPLSDEVDVHLAIHAVAR
jgi:polyisoprenoid-binding protein YceI